MIDMTYLVMMDFAPFVGIFFMFVFLALNSQTEGFVRDIFFKILLLELTEMLVYSMELVTAEAAEPSMLRVLLSVIGYTIRPILAYLIVMLNKREKITSRQRIIFGLPLTINTVAAFSAFFSGIVFSYTPDNHFSRGPLGYIPQMVLVLYFIMIVINVLHNMKQKDTLETVIAMLSLLLAVFAMEIEKNYNYRSLGRTAIVMSTIFYYMYFQTQAYKIQLDSEKDKSKHYQRYSSVDRLTGLLNKTAFTERLDMRLAKANTSSGLIFFDLDNFKNFNDTLGHLTGDELLKEVAERLERFFRSSDLIGRFGGDEFYIFLEDIPYSILDERIRRLKSELEIQWKDTDCRVTASLGICFIPAGIKISSKEVLELADQALYEAKRAGRNCYRINHAGSVIRKL